MKKLILFFFTLILVGFCIWQSWQILFYSSYFSLQDVRISGASILSKEEILKIGNITMGKNIFSMEFKKISQDLIASPVILQAELFHVGPSSLEIRIEEVKPKYWFFFGSSVYSVSSEGCFFVDPAPVKRPKVYYSPTAAETERSCLDEGRLQGILSWVSMLEGGNFSDFDRIEFAKSGYVQIFWKEIKIFARTVESFVLAIEKIETLVKEAQESSLRIEYIDLRFENMVVKTA